MTWPADSKRTRHRYCTAAHRERRKAVLAGEPVCAICNVAPAVEVDHVIPLCENGAYGLAKCQAVCVPCHRKKSGREGARARARRKAALAKLAAMIADGVTIL